LTAVGEPRLCSPSAVISRRPLAPGSRVRAQVLGLYGRALPLVPGSRFRADASSAASLRHVHHLRIPQAMDLKIHEVDRARGRIGDWRDELLPDPIENRASPDEKDEQDSPERVTLSSGAWRGRRPGFSTAAIAWPEAGELAPC